MLEYTLITVLEFECFDAQTQKVYPLYKTQHGGIEVVSFLYGLDAECTVFLWNYEDYVVLQIKNAFCAPIPNGVEPLARTICPN